MREHELRLYSNCLISLIRQQNGNVNNARRARPANALALIVPGGSIYIVSGGRHVCSRQHSVHSHWACVLIIGIIHVKLQMKGTRDQRDVGGARAQ